MPALAKPPVLKAVQNVAVRFSYPDLASDSASLSCDWDGAHYHVWIRVREGDTFVIEGPLYKNPPPDVSPGTDAHYPTRLLDWQKSMASGAIVDAMTSALQAGGLIAQAREHRRAERERLLAEHLDQVRSSQIEAEAGRMYALLLEVKRTQFDAVPRESVPAPVRKIVELLDGIDRAVSKARSDATAVSTMLRQRDDQ